MFQTADTLKFDRYAFAPFHPIVYIGTLVSFTLFLGLALWLPVRLRAAGTILDFSILLLTITLTSPIAWVHHYGVVLPVLVAVAPGMLVARPFGRYTAAVLTLAYIPVSQFVDPSLLGVGPLSGLTQSYVFAGAVVILLMLYASAAAIARTIQGSSLSLDP